MIRNYEFRFELRPGKYVFVPTKKAKVDGDRIANRVLSRWKASPHFYHMKKSGGHVASMRPHLKKQFHASLDLSNFFETVSRTKVHRALMKVGFRNREALEIATESCVEHNGRKFLPYGFPQSMVLATLVVDFSALGRKILDLKANGIIITVYVDDILISSDDISELQEAYDEVKAAVNLSGFSISSSKSEAPNREVKAFNCSISSRMELLPARMARFRDKMKTASPKAKSSVLRYVNVINPSQAIELSILA